MTKRTTTAFAALLLISMICATSHTLMAASIPATTSASTQAQALPELPAPNPDKAVTAISRFGKPTYEHTKLVNPNAPKGGTFRLATTGTFDVVNDKIVRGIGTCAQGLTLTWEPLMARSAAEPFALYALVAEKIEFAKDQSYVTIYLNPKARFHNGDAVTTADIQTTMETLRDKGVSRYKKFYGSIAKVVVHSPLVIQFQLKPDESGMYDQDLPLIIASMPVLSKKQLDRIDFANSSLTPIMGTGPYMVDHVQQGRTVSFKRNPNYWAADLPIAKGQFNFDKIRIEYFKNATAHFQAFLAKEFDIFFETDPRQWKNGYNTDAVRRGDIVRKDLHHERSVAVRTIIMNMRRPIFHDIELRRALLMAFDADSLNRMVFDGTMNVPHSLFANTVLAHQGAAEGREKELLLKHASKIEPKLLKRMLAEPFSPARTNGAGDQRENLKKAAEILNAAGYTIQKGKRIAPDGSPVQLSIMIKDDRLEKIALSLRESLKAIGIDLTVRKFDANTYETRVIESDFDMIIHTWANSMSPGTEQAYFFGVKAADIKGSANFIGLKDPVAEALAQEVALATDFEELKARVHALDRYVMHLCLQIPLAYDNNLRFAYWKDKLAIPPISTKFDVNVMNRGWDPKAEVNVSMNAGVKATDAPKNSATDSTTRATSTATNKDVPCDKSCSIFCKIRAWFSRLF
jgi:microcin C transport system substrate-binding protein